MKDEEGWAGVQSMLLPPPPPPLQLFLLTPPRDPLSPPLPEDPSTISHLLLPLFLSVYVVGNGNV